MRIERPMIVWLGCTLVACSNGPRPGTPVEPRPVRPRPRAHVAPAERPVPRRPLASPQVYEDRLRLTALQAAVARTPEPHALLALGRLAHLAGQGTRARQAWARARALMRRQGATFRPEVVMPGGLSGFAWQGSTLALIRSLLPATRDYRGGWAWLELWDRKGDAFPAPRLRVGPGGGGGDVAWAGATALWWHRGRGLHLVDARTGRALRRLSTGRAPQPRHVRFTRLVAVAQTSGHVAATCDAQSVRVWNARGKVVRDVKLKGHTSQMIRANMGTHCEMRSVRTPVTVSRLALGPRGRRLAIGANDGKLRLVDVRTGRVRILAQKWRPMRYAFPRNPFDRRHPLRLWFTGVGTRLHLLQADSSHFEWDARTGGQRRHWQPSCQPKHRPRPGRTGLVTPRLRRRWARQRCTNVWDADLAPDGKVLATARGSIHRWRVPQGGRLPDLPVKRARGLRFDATGALLAVSRYYAGGEIWRLAGPKKVGALNRPTVEGQLADLSAEGRYLAIWVAKDTWGKDRRVAVWDLTARQRLGVLTVWGPEAVRFTADGRALVAGVGDGVELWQLAPWKRVRRLAGAKLRAQGRGLTTAGEQIVVWGYQDKRWRLWQRTTGAVRDYPALAGVTRAVLSPDGTRLALLSDQQVTLWDVVAGRVLRTLPEKRAHACAWSRSGRLVALGSRLQRSVRIVDVATGTERAALQVKHAADTLHFGPSDRELVIGGIGLLGRWSFPAGQSLVPLTQANRHLSPREVRFGPGDRRLIVFGFYHRAVSVWDLAAGTLLADLWPVQGGHWVATSAAGAADATAVGRETLVTLVPPRSSAGRVAGQRRSEAVYGWELGWACFSRPALVAAAVAGRSVRPPRRPGCAIAP